MQLSLSFISILFAFISTVFASPLRILDNNIQAISERDKVQIDIPKLANNLPKRVDASRLLDLWKPQNHEFELLAGKSSDFTYKLNEKYDNHLAMIKGIRRDSSKAEEEEKIFIHEIVYLEKENMLLGWTEAPGLYFIVIKDDEYVRSKDVGLTNGQKNTLRQRTMRYLEDKYPDNFVIWNLKFNSVFRPIGTPGHPEWELVFT